MDIDEAPIKEFVRDTLNIELDLHTNHDLRPTQTVATIGNDRQQVNPTWGIQPAWAKKLLINAQSETVAEKKTFRNAFAESRCMVPCSGWYEWRDEGGPRKQKYHFAAADGNPLLMGGILFPGEEGPKLITLTIDPNKECAEYHHRMPQFVPHQHLEQWLTGSVEEALQLVTPLPDDSVQIQRA
jgi:putative SOS response-associated peptidase YedK